MFPAGSSSTRCKEPPERGRRRNLHPGEIEAFEGLADLPQAPSDHPARSRGTLGRLIGQTRVARLAEPFRRNLPPAQGGDLAARILELPNRRRLERLDQRIDQLQHAVDLRLPAQLPERRADVFGDGPTAVLQVHDLGRRVLRRRAELISRTDKLEKRFDGIEKRFDGVATRFDEVNKRFDGVTRELADLRERMAKLEGALEGFLAGRRDRDAA